MKSMSKLATLSAVAVATSVVAAIPAMASAAAPIAIGSCAADVTGLTYTLTEDCRTFSTLEFPDGATLDGDDYTITAVEDATHANFPGPVVKSATGTDSAAASLHVRDLTITGEFSGSNSGGRLHGIEMIRAGGSLTDVVVDGISHGNGTQEGNAISIRNRVDANNMDVPRAHITLSNVTANNYQKTGVLLDGNLTFTGTDLHVGAAGSIQAGPMAPGVNAANAVQISRGAQGSLTDSEISNNRYHTGLPYPQDDGSMATAILLYNAGKVELARNTVTGAGDMGVYAYNLSNTLTTNLDISCMVVENTDATPVEGSVGVYMDEESSKPGSLNATVKNTVAQGWETDIIGDEVVTDGECTAPATWDVTGHATARKIARKARVDMFSDALPAHSVEGKQLKWKITVDGRTAFVTKQHPGNHARWARTFGPHSGRHTVAVFKNGEQVKTLIVRTNV